MGILISGGRVVVRGQESKGNQVGGAQGTGVSHRQPGPVTSTGSIGAASPIALNFNAWSRWLV